jgi:hypothetical protein
VETPAAAPNAQLALKDRPRTVAADHDSNEDHQGQGESDQRASGDEISEAPCARPESWPQKPNKNGGRLESPLRFLLSLFCLAVHLC